MKRLVVLLAAMIAMTVKPVDARQTVGVADLSGANAVPPNSSPMVGIAVLNLNAQVEGLTVFAATASIDRESRVAVDVDSSLRVAGVHLGVRRSPLRSPRQVVEVVRAAQRAGLTVAGLMFYDAQIAGLPDSSPAVLWSGARARA